MNYCNSIGRNDIARQKPFGNNWYDIHIGAPDYHLSFTITHGRTARVLIYTYTPETFQHLEKQKTAIEAMCGFDMNWYSSRSTRTQKRIIYGRGIDFFAEDKQRECFDWFIACFDKIKNALVACDLNA